MRPRNPLLKLLDKNSAVEDTLDLTFCVANDIIAQIHSRGLDFEDSDEEEEQNKERSLSSSSGGTSSGIWRSDWDSDSLKQPFVFKNRSDMLFDNMPYQQSAEKSNHSTSGHSEALCRNESFSSLYAPPVYTLPLPLTPYQEPYTNFEVVYERIGEDARTTSMLKNIPNKYSLQNLIREIDETHGQQYDFLYLPFDYTVARPPLRATATWATRSSTSWRRPASRASTRCTTGASGASSAARRSAR